MLEIAPSVVNRILIPILSVRIKRPEKETMNRMTDIPPFEVLNTTMCNEKPEETLEEKLAAIHKILKELKGFQSYESDAIEFELQEVLESYLVAEYHLMKVERFRMKKISDPIKVKYITDFDASFLVQNINYQPDYIRLK